MFHKTSEGLAHVAYNRINMQTPAERWMSGQSTGPPTHKPLADNYPRMLMA